MYKMYKVKNIVKKKKTKRTKTQRGKETADEIYIYEEAAKKEKETIRYHTQHDTHKIKTLK